MSVQQEKSLSLIESIRYAPHEGHFLLHRHLERLHNSACQLGFMCDLDAIAAALLDVGRELTALSKVRLQLSRSGAFEIEAQTIIEEPCGLFAVACHPVASDDWRLKHKTSNRVIYERACQGVAGGATDIVLWNERGELTETCRGNLVAWDGQEWFTPPRQCGLLPGTFRAQLLHEGKLREAVLRLDQIRQWQALYRINSVRQWTRIELASALT